MYKLPVQAHGELSIRAGIPYKSCCSPCPEIFALWGKRKSRQIKLYNHVGQSTESIRRYVCVHTHGKRNLCGGCQMLMAIKIAETRSLSLSSSSSPCLLLSLFDVASTLKCNCHTFVKCLCCCLLLLLLLSGLLLLLSLLLLHLHILAI